MLIDAAGVAYRGLPVTDHAHEPCPPHQSAASVRRISPHLKRGEPRRRRQHEDLDTVIAVTDIDDCYRQISAVGADILQRLREAPYRRELHIADPHGNVIGFCSAA